MKKIKFTCTSCQARLRVPTHLAGVSAPCPKCGATITAPTDISSAVEDDAPVRRSSLSESYRGRQTSSTLNPGGGNNPVPVAAASAAPAVSKLEESALHSDIRPQQTARASVTSSTLVLERGAPLPVKETAVAPEPHPVPAPQPEPAPVPEPEPVVPDDSLPASDLDREDPYVVVEVLNVPIEQPPPLAPITQPIQVNPRSSILPEVKSDATVTSPPLPRLDFTLAGQESGNLAAVLFSEEGSQPGRMVVKLPQPGAEPHQFNPDDFVVPVATAEVPGLETEYGSGHPVSGDAAPELPEFDDSIAGLEDEFEPIPLEEVNLPSFEETLPFFPTEGSGLDIEEREEELVADDDLSFLKSEAVEDTLPISDTIGLNERNLPPVTLSAASKELPWNNQQSTPRAEEAVHRTLSTDWQSMDTQPIPTLGAIRETRSDQEPDIRDVGYQGGSLHEGSVGNLFSRKPDTDMVPSDERDPSSPFEAPERLDLKDEGHVLDEIFGSPPGRSKGMSKTAVVMLCGIGGAAIIATVVVIFLINLMGGLDPKLAYTDAEDTEEASAGKVTEPTVALEEPSIDGAPPVIDPVAMLREETGAIPPSTGSSPPTPRVDAAPDSPSGGEAVAKPAGSTEAPALSFDERVERVVNGTDQFSANQSSPGAPAVVEPGISAPSSNPVDSAIESFKGASTGTPAASPAGSSSDASANYNPPASFAAPGPDDGPLRNTNDLIDAFLRAPNWEARLKYTYQGESLRPAIGDYYGKWADKKIERFSLQLFQMEKVPSLGGPFWVYLVSTSDQDQGFPLIVRVEEGNLKVDWEIYSEFFDRHFVRFKEGKMPKPATFRLVVERVSDYYGSDREGFKDLASYNVYQINPPYGDLNEFSRYAFAKKDSEVAKKLDAVVGLSDDPLAVIITLDEKPLEHGVKHLLITDYVTEGWFR